MTSTETVAVKLQLGTIARPLHAKASSESDSEYATEVGRHATEVATAEKRATQLRDQFLEAPNDMEDLDCRLCQQIKMLITNETGANRLAIKYNHSGRQMVAALVAHSRACQSCTWLK